MFCIRQRNDKHFFPACHLQKYQVWNVFIKTISVYLKQKSFVDSVWLIRGLKGKPTYCEIVAIYYLHTGITSRTLVDIYSSFFNWSLFITVWQDCFFSHSCKHNVIWFPLHWNNLVFKTDIFWKPSPSHMKVGEIISYLHKDD